MNGEKRERILIIDDDVYSCRMVEFILQKRGFETESAGTGRDALARVEGNSFGAALLDIRLPDVEGTDLIKPLRERQPDMAVIMVTGHASQETAITALNEGAFAYITKPVNMDEVLAALREALEKRRLRIQNRRLFQEAHRELEEKGRLAEELRKSRASFFDIVERSALGMLVTDTANIVRFANPSACRLFGRDEATLVGADFGLPVMPGEMTEVDVVRPNGEPGVAEIRVEPTEWEGEEARLVMLIDVTEQIKAKDTIKKTVEELKKANQKILEQQTAVIEEERLKVLLQMAGATAHELNQPLTTLLGNIELMRLNRDQPEALEMNLARIEKAGRRISEIVKKIQTIRHDETKPYLEGADIINFDQKVRILSVEDEVSYFRAMERMLRKDGNLDLVHASTHTAAMGLLARQPIDLILLDHLMPEGDSFAFFERMNEQDLEIPVVIITGQGDEVIATQVIQAGAYDYLPKTSVGRKSLKRSIFNALEKFRLKQEVHKAMGKMAEMSARDALTGLYNRRYFRESLEKEMDRSRRYGKGLALCMIDLDHFKRVNDTYGHAAGDSVLKELTGLLRRSIRKSDIPCRYGGEEFVVILPEADAVRAMVVAKRFRQTVEAHAFTAHEPPIRLTVSVGIAAGQAAGNGDADGIVEAADRALYRAKAGGRNRVILSEAAEIPSSMPACGEDGGA